MNENEISKVLSGETDISKMSNDDFVELLRCLGRMYFTRVMNCVDGTGKYDKEWTALSSIFSRVAATISEKPVGNSAALREVVTALAYVILPPREEYPAEYGGGKVPDRDGWLAWIRAMQAKAFAALAAPPRNCDAMDWRTAWKIWREKFHPETPVGYSAVVKGTEAFMDWFTAPATELKGGNNAD